MKNLIYILILLIFSNFSVAGPWVSPGENQLRHHLQYLADTGVINTPLTSWPVNWSNIKRDLDDANISSLTSSQLWSYRFISFEADRQTAGVFAEVRAKYANEPTIFAGFDDYTREEQEFTARLDLLYSKVSLNLVGTYIEDPLDDREARLDGSHLAFNIGNWAWGIGAVDRWWSPGWQHSLILSNSARPSPGLFLKRNYDDAFTWKILRWLGPWELEMFANQLESDREVPNAKFLGARFSFKPTQQLEIGLSRTAQWGGEGRPQDLESLVNLIIGNDNRSESLTIDEEPGNQLAGFDARFGFSLFGLTHGIYGQFIGEDEAGGLPSRLIAMAGLETVIAAENIHSRLGVELANTTSEFYEDGRPNFTYHHGIYRTGYRYFGRPIGDSIDSDSESITLFGQHYFSSGWEVNWKIMNVRINVDGGGNSSFVSEFDSHQLVDISLAIPIDSNLRAELALFYIDNPIEFLSEEVETGGSLVLRYRY